MLVWYHTAKDNGSIGRSKTIRERMDRNMTVLGSEWKRMVSGRLYDPADREIAKRHRAGMIRCDRFNRIALRRAKAKQRALEKLVQIGRASCRERVSSPV